MSSRHVHRAPSAGPSPWTAHAAPSRARGQGDIDDADVKKHRGLDAAREPRASPAGAHPVRCPADCPRRAGRSAPRYDLPPEVMTVVCGHTHMPFTRLANTRQIINPGGVGMPYGRQGAPCAILSGGMVEIRRAAPWGRPRRCARCQLASPL
jgi:hypothetical protein